MKEINKKKLRIRLEKCFSRWQKEGYEAFQRSECQLGWSLVPKTFTLDIMSIVLSTIREVAKMKLKEGELRVYYNHSGIHILKMDFDIEKVLKKYGYKRWASGCNLLTSVRDLCFEKMSKEEPPLTCKDCGRELTDDEVAYFFDNIKDDDDKPYCNGCISRMDTTEGLVDDSLMEGE